MLPEVLRLKADYTGFEISPKAAEEVVCGAEVFVRTVEREFGLEAPAKESTVGKDTLPTENQDADLGSTHSRSESVELAQHRPSAEETRRKAREDWLKNYYHKGNGTNQAGLQTDSRQRDEQKAAGKPQPERDTGIDHDPE
jgi:hypothetical protein